MSAVVVPFPGAAINPPSQPPRTLRDIAFALHERAYWCARSFAMGMAGTPDTKAWDARKACDFAAAHIASSLVRRDANNPGDDMLTNAVNEWAPRLRVLLGLLLDDPPRSNRAEWERIVGDARTVLAAIETGGAA